MAWFESRRGNETLRYASTVTCGVLVHTEVPPYILPYSYLLVVIRRSSIRKYGVRTERMQARSTYVPPYGSTRLASRSLRAHGSGQYLIRYGVRSTKLTYLVSGVLLSRHLLAGNYYNVTPRPVWSRISKSYQPRAVVQFVILRARLLFSINLGRSPEVTL